MRHTPRPRRVVGKRTIIALTPFFRHSLIRDAYVLRGIGDRYGPVLVTRDSSQRERRRRRTSPDLAPRGQEMPTSTPDRPRDAVR